MRLFATNVLNCVYEMGTDLNWLVLQMVTMGKGSSDA